VNRIGLLLWLVLLLTGWGAFAEVPYERIAAAGNEPNSWLTYSGTYSSHRYSKLAEITADNVSQLRVAWVYQVRRPGLVEATPLVADGVMYITEPPSTVTALDLRSGRPLWSWSPKMPRDVRHIGFPAVNRGIAILDDMVYVGTLDAHLVALDAKSGLVRWDVVVADNKTAHSITHAPLALDGKIIVGISGGEAGIRGFLAAYHAKSGERLWRFWTIPGPGEPGHDTWGGDSWKTGAGATWLTGSYDPHLNLLYWGVGNPGPDWNGDVRPGDNLFTCSLVALDPSSGKLKWHFQFTPHDVHDWDANQIPVLVDGEFAGQPRKLIATANRNAFYYVLDRETGQFLAAAPYAKQTWAKSIDGRGRPIVLPGTEPSEKGTLVWPSLQGATNWFSPSYSPRTNLFYVAVREMGSYYFKSDVEFEPGKPFLGGGEQALGADESSGAIRALDVMTGRQKWQFPLHSPPWAGLLSTAGGLVFGGSNEGNFFALDDRTGRALWQFQTGGAIRANPISFAIDDRQHIAIASGNAIFVFELP
jgi:alcohol dehydrogenase (cytochrome c)